MPSSVLHILHALSLMYLILNPVTSAISSFNRWRNWTIESDFPRLHSELSSSAGIWTLALWYQSRCPSSLYWFSSQYPFSLYFCLPPDLRTECIYTLARDCWTQRLGLFLRWPWGQFYGTFGSKEVWPGQWTVSTLKVAASDSVTCPQCLSLFLCNSL